MARLFIFGLGYSALALAGHLRNSGWEVAGTTRRADKLADLRRLGFTVYPFARESPLGVPAATLAEFPYILHSVPPDELGDPVFDLHAGDLVDLAPALRWFGYLSSTGVYGDHGGARVDEDSACAPTSARGRLRLRAERGWADLQARCGLPAHIFRLAGIYGPGRNVLRGIAQGTARRVIKPGHLFNRIHVEDVAQCLAASMHRPAPGRAYNLADDMPAASADVVAYGAQLLGAAPPPEIPYAEADLSPMSAAFYRDNKIITNDRIKTELGVKLRFPDYRAGLTACARGMLPPAEDPEV